ncbi:MAG TPA: hypothetical protein DIU15_19695, partial [Deltaproteobacteria bacterium]|nr:hypothetical protein [Deltaproteobacteria bacterium]
MNAQVPPPFATAARANRGRQAPRRTSVSRTSGWSIATFALAVLLPLSASAFDPKDVDPGTVHALGGGGPVLVVEESPSGQLELVTGGAFFDASPEQVWKTISDYASYPEWMPDLTEIEVTNDKGTTKDVHYKVHFQIAIISKKIDYVLKHTETPPHRISWDLIEGDFDKTVGAWNLVPLDNGKGTLVFYSTFTNLKSMGWLVKQLLTEQPGLEVAIQASTALVVLKALQERL